MRPPTDEAACFNFVEIDVGAASTYCAISAVLTLVKVTFSCVPRPLTTAMMATEIPAAIRPYSIAVAPDSSLRNALNLSFMGFPTYA